MEQSYRLKSSYNKQNIFPILVNKYQLLKKVGCGATCTVKLARIINTEKLFAIKIMKAKDRKNAQVLEITFQNEIDALSILHSDNLINMLEFGEGTLKKLDNSEKIVKYIVLEYASRGELFDYLYFPKQGFIERIARAIFKQLIVGVEECHKSGIVHRDIKTENLLLDHNWRLKIGDFGYSTFFKGNEPLKAFLGTLSYTAPEILQKIPYNAVPIDIFSCGVVLFVIVTGSLPMEMATVNDTFYKYFFLQEYQEFWKNISRKIPFVCDEFKSLITVMMAADPTIRPSIEEIKNHPWMKGDFADDNEILTEFCMRKQIIENIKHKNLSKENLKCKEKVDENPGSNIRNSIGPRKVKEFSENEINPFKIFLIAEDLNNVLSLIVSYFSLNSKKHEVFFNQISSKLQVSYDIEVCDSDFDNFMLEVEIKKHGDEKNLWIIELTRIRGDKKFLSDIFEELKVFVEKCIDTNNKDENVEL